MTNILIGFVFSLCFLANSFASDINLKFEFPKGQLTVEAQAFYTTTQNDAACNSLSFDKMSILEVKVKAKEITNKMLFNSEDGYLSIPEMIEKDGCKYIRSSFPVLLFKDLTLNYRSYDIVSIEQEKNKNERDQYFKCEIYSSGFKKVSKEIGCSLGTITVNQDGEATIIVDYVADDE